MCKCTPDIRTPVCGKPGCEWPKQKEKQPPMNCQDIIKKHLEDNGFDGLCSLDCGCNIEDLCCCHEDFTKCVPGYKWKPSEEICEECDVENCDFQYEPLLDSKHNQYCIRTEKP